MRRLAIVAITLIVVIGTTAGAANITQPRAQEDTAPCSDPVFIEGQGLSCKTGNGLWLVRITPDLWLPTHGPDPMVSTDDGTPGGNPGSHDVLVDRATPKDPTCAGSLGGEFLTRVIYAYSYKSEDRYDEFVDDIRQTVREANGMVRFAADEEDGAFRNLKVACWSDRTIVVEKLRLYSDPEEVTFSSVVADAVEDGHYLPTEKYWIFVDPNSENISWSGTANMWFDSRDSHNNRHNYGQAYAIAWGTFDAGTWLHELMHNMGAVQPDAPNYYLNYGGSHCDDEWDVMCYGEETYVRCSEEHLDCGHDDYFDPVPEPGTYLEDHWNIAGEKNRFITTTPSPCEGWVKVKEDSGSDPCLLAVGVTGARASYGAVSLFGGADGDVAVSGFGPANGPVAASGLNDCGEDTCVDVDPSSAHAGTLAVSPGESEGPVAVAGTGASDGEFVAVSGTGPSQAEVAASGGSTSEGAVAVSGLGDAHGCRPVGLWPACVAASGTGNSSANILAVSGTGAATGAAHGGLVAVSGTGSADGYAAVSGFGDARGIWGVSGTGDTRGIWSVSGTGSAEGDVAVSGTGHADGDLLSVSGCDTGTMLGSDAACHDLDPHPLLP